MQYVQRTGKNQKLAQEQEITNSEIEYRIDERIHSQRDRAILKRRFIDGICYEPLSEEFGLSVRQTKNIVYKHQYKIFD